MDKFYCRECAAKRGRNTEISPSNWTGTVYQRDKFDKHTNMPTASGQPTSVLDDPSYLNYAGLGASALAFGWVAENSLGKLSLAWNANQRVGLTYLPTGQRIDSAIRVVLPTKVGKIHLYPTANSEIQNARCADCGKLYSS